MAKISWGGLVAAHLSLGAPLIASCGPQPAPRPPAPDEAPAASASAPPAEAEPEAPTGFGAWAPLAPAPPSKHRPRTWLAAASDKGVFGLARSPAGREVFGGVRSRIGRIGCAWNGAADESCTGFFFAPWKDGQGSPARWPVGAVGAWTPLKVSYNWPKIWPGRAGAYAVATPDTEQVVAILDPQGERTFKVASEIPGAPNGIEQIVETADGPVALWVTRKEASKALWTQRQDATRPPLDTVTSAPLTLADGKATIGKPTQHQILVVESAQQARDAIRNRMVPVVTWEAIPNVNDKGELDKAFLLTWYEAIPPKRLTPRFDPREKELLRWRFTSCGSSPTRAATDGSVVKRIMVRRVARDGSSLGQHEVGKTAWGEPMPTLRLEPRPRAKERLVPDSEQTELPDGLIAPPEQCALAAGYSPVQREGVVVLEQAGELVAQRFDAQGSPVGEATKLGPKRSFLRRAELSSEGWMALTSPGNSLLMLTGPRAGAEIKLDPVGFPDIHGFIIPSDTSTFVLAIGEAPPPSKYHRYGDRAFLFAEVPKGATAASFKPIPIRPYPSTIGAATMLDDGNLVFFLQYRIEEERIVMSRDGKEISSEKLPRASAYKSVYGDAVLIHENIGAGKPVTGTWLRKGTTADFGNPDVYPDGFFFARGGTVALPSTPGPITRIAPPPPGLLRNCVDELPVGPKASLVLCSKPFGDESWLATAGAILVRH